MQKLAAAQSQLKILVFRALKLGDMLCSIPAFRALRQAFPTAEIHYLGLPWAREFVKYFSPYIDQFIEFPGFPGMPETQSALDEIPRFLSSMQSRKFDLAIQMHGSGTISNPLLSVFAPLKLVGFYKKGEFCPDQNSFLIYPEDMHEIKRNLYLLQVLNIKNSDYRLEFPLVYDDLQSLQIKFAGHGYFHQDIYVCLHPGASTSSKMWELENFVTIGKFLSRKGIKVLVTGGQAEWKLTDELSKKIGQGAWNTTAYHLNLGELAWLYRKAALVVCNDTGVSHLACAVNTAVFVIFKRHELIPIWSPLNVNRAKTYAAKQAATLSSLIADLDNCLAAHRYQGCS